MPEKVIVRQNMRYEVEFLYADPEDEDANEYHVVHGLHEVTPYGMMLLSLGTCTAQIVLSYAQNHGIGLDEVEFFLEYSRKSKDVRSGSDEARPYDDKIFQRLKFIGDINEEENQKLYEIAHRCPIEVMFKRGIKIESEHVA